MTVSFGQVVFVVPEGNGSERYPVGRLKQRTGSQERGKDG